MLGISLKPRGWRNSLACVLLAVAFLVLAANSSADTVVNPFAGTWSTFGGSGSVKLQAVDAATGQAAVQADGGGAGCGAPTFWYSGSYSDSSDHGEISGCTNSTGQHLIGWYVSSVGPQHGTVSIDISSDLASFSGEYDELSDQGTGTGLYSGVFSGDFAFSGRTAPPSPSLPVVPPPSAWGQPTAATTLAPGAGIVLQSPPLGPAQQQATVSVPVDQSTTLALIAENGPSKPGDCVYLALAGSSSLALGDELANGSEFSPGVDALFSFGYLMVTCLDFVQRQHTPGVAGHATTSATAAQACHLNAVRIRQVRGKGHRYRALKRDPKPPIAISCTRTRHGLRIHIKTRTGTRPLSASVGPRLLIGLYRSPVARSKANVKATFAAR